jgi:hypothetical protein
LRGLTPGTSPPARNSHSARSTPTAAPGPQAFGRSRRRSAGGPSPPCALDTGRAVTLRLAARSRRSRALGSCRRGALLDRHRQVGEQVQVLVGLPAQRRQVVADDQRVEPAEDALPGAEIAERQLAPPGNRNTVRGSAGGPRGPAPEPRRGTPPRASVPRARTAPRAPLRSRGPWHRACSRTSVTDGIVSVNAPAFTGHPRNGALTGPVTRPATRPQRVSADQRDAEDAVLGVVCAAEGVG